MTDQAPTGDAARRILSDDECDAIVYATVSGWNGRFMVTNFRDVIRTTYREAWQAALAQQSPAEPVASARGYAHLGIGAYIINHSRAGEIPELCISFASDEDKRTRVVGDSIDNEPDSEVPAKDMLVRLRFENAAGLGALETQLRLLRQVHFPDAAEPVAGGPATQGEADRGPGGSRGAGERQPGRSGQACVGRQTEKGKDMIRYFIGDTAYQLILSPRETEIAEVKWGGTKRVAGALSYADGFANTEAMAAAGSKLAAQIRAMRIEGFDDWYLPSRLESLLLFGELPKVFEQDWYWTSTQYAGTAGSAWLQHFYGGTQYGGRKDGHCRARAVRRVAL